MPTIFSHPVVPIALAVGLGNTTLPKRLLCAGVVASIVPDLDVLAFRFGIAYAHDLGHRGISHSIFFAVVLALASVPFAKMLQSTPRTVFLFILVCAASHGLLDMFTNGGMGVAYFWPFSSERHFLPYQVIQVSSLKMSRVFSPAGLAVFKSELMWLWLPAMAMACTAYLVRSKVAKNSGEPHGY